MTHIRLQLCLCVALLALAGCGEAGPSPEAIARAATLLPADPELAQLYQQTCISCHATTDAVAPLTGDREAWEPLLAQGMDTLLAHTINGYERMPALGSCSDCSADDFRALIRFMAGLDEATP